MPAIIVPVATGLPVLPALTRRFGVAARIAIPAAMIARTVTAVVVAIAHELAILVTVTILRSATVVVIIPIRTRTMHAAPFVVADKAAIFVAVGAAAAVRAAVVVTHE